MRTKNSQEKTAKRRLVLPNHEHWLSLGKILSSAMWVVAFNFHTTRSLTAFEMRHERRPATINTNTFHTTNFAVRFSLRQSISDWPTHSRTVPKKSCQMDLRRLNQKLRWKTASTKSPTTSDFLAIKRSSLPLENLPRRRQRIEINTTAQS